MSFLTPMGLLLGLLAVPLVALYFLRIRRRKVRVSSLLPWHAVKRSEQLASPFQRFRRNLLLLLQLLVLALLVLAAARPFQWTDELAAHSLVLVVDTSASMGATDGAPTRLDDARAEARRLLDGLSVDDEAMIVVAGPRTEVAAPFTRDRGLLRVALDGIVQTEASADLEEGLRLALSLARTRPDVEVVVLSDGGPGDLSRVPAGQVPVRYVRLGRSRENAGIVALDLRRSPVSDAVQQLFVTVRNFGDTDGRGSVVVTLDGRRLDVRTEPLPPAEPVAMVFDLPVGSRGELKVELAWPGDTLPADDVAWAVVEEGVAADVLLVGGDGLLAKILASDPRIEATRVPTGAVTPELVAKADAVVFGDEVPATLDLTGLHYAILGPSRRGPVALGPLVAAPRVLGWNRTHPLTRYTSWDRAVLTESHAVLDTGGLLSLVDGDAGPLVLAGERSGGRVVQLTFDPLQSDLPMRVAWPVFVLNTVGWLTEAREGRDTSGHVPTGRPWVRRVGELTGTPSVAGPGRPSVRLEDGQLRVGGIDQVGIYKVDLGGARYRFAANLLAPGESAVAPRADLGLGAGEGADIAQAGVAGRRELWRPLLWAALAMLLLEWLAYHRRKVA